LFKYILVAVGSMPQNNVYSERERLGPWKGPFESVSNCSSSYASSSYQPWKCSVDEPRSSECEMSLAAWFGWRVGRAGGECRAVLSRPIATSVMSCGLRTCQGPSCKLWGSSNNTNIILSHPEIICFQNCINGGFAGLIGLRLINSCSIFIQQTLWNFTLTTKLMLA
jgi:hypothetical protein